MAESAEALLKKALTLDEKDRASLAGALIESLLGEPMPGDQDEWDAEIKRRVEELESNAVETVPWSEVRERLFRGYE
jgi:putative addiction module component (TIGR02574 family)